MELKLSLIILTVLACKTVVADMVLPRKFPACGYLNSKIYCYGGDTSITTTERAIDTTLYSLNIDQFVGQQTDTMNNKWEVVNPNVPFYTEARRLPNAIVLSDGKRLLLHGGTKTVKGQFVNQTIVYDSTTNTWEAVTPYAEEDRGVRQIYLSAVVNLPNNTVGFYGGYEQMANISVPQISYSGINMPYQSNNRSNVGFTDLKTYSLETTKWTSFSPQIDAPKDYYPNSQTANFDPTSGKVYFFGGGYINPIINVTQEIRSNFGWGYTFNTKTGAWLNETFSGVIPRTRDYHSSHLLPNSRDIILYGGTEDYKKASIDYCFTLNLVDNMWTKRSDVNVPIILSGPRFSHSSVIVNTTLYVFFGKGVDGIFTSSILSIDVANVSNIAYIATVGVSSDVVISETNNSTTEGKNTSPPSSSSGLSKGAVGGIAAGAVVALLVIAAAIVYCIRRKKKPESDSQIDVDWDKIDEHFRESPNPANASPLTTSNKVEIPSPIVETIPQFQAKTNFVDSHPVIDNQQTHYFTENFNVTDIGMMKPSVDINTVQPSYSVIRPSVDIETIKTSVDVGNVKPSTDA